MGWSRLRRPSSCSFSTSAATKVLVSEPISKGVNTETGLSPLPTTRSPEVPSQRLPSGNRTAAATPGAPCETRQRSRRACRVAVRTGSSSPGVWAAARATDEQHQQQSGEGGAEDSRRSVGDHGPQSIAPPPNQPSPASGFGHLTLLSSPCRRGGRVVEGDGLENRWAKASWVRIPPSPPSMSRAEWTRLQGRSVSREEQAIRSAGDSPHATLSILLSVKGRPCHTRSDAVLYGRDRILVT